MLDPAYITPFIKSIQNVFSMMLQLEVSVEEPSIKDDQKATYDVSGIIGLSGDVTGSVVLSFPTDTAERMVTLFTGEQIEPEHEDFADAIGELVNMVSGNAKADFKGQDVSISTPSVVVGADHHISRPKDIPCVIIPCVTDCGDLVIEVAIQITPAERSQEGNLASAAGNTIS